MGGGARCDGLPLYPLQWLLIESQHQGLVLQHNPQRNLIEDPLALVFPSWKPSSPTNQVTNTRILWEYQYANGIKVQMQDLRSSHNHGNMQTLPRKLTEKRPGSGNTYKSKPTRVVISSSDNATTAASSDMDTSRRPPKNGTRRGKRAFFKGLFEKQKSTDTSSDLTNLPEHDQNVEPSSSTSINLMIFNT